jgi:hypothetical protein
VIVSYEDIASGIQTMHGRLEAGWLTSNENTVSQTGTTPSEFVLYHPASCKSLVMETLVALEMFCIILDSYELNDRSLIIGKGMDFSVYYDVQTERETHPATGQIDDVESFPGGEETG